MKFKPLISLSAILNLGIGAGTIACLIACLIACEDPAPVELPTLDLESPVLPQTETILTESSQGQESGHWPREVRAVAIDEEDYIILSTAQDDISGAFGTLVLNIPLIDKRTSEECLSGMRALEKLPSRTVPVLLNEITSRGFEFDRVVVQVDLFKPQRDDFHRLCLEESGASDPSYYIPEIRSDVISAFEDLAQVEGIDAIVVGLELNRYAELSEMSPYNRSWDYVNLVSLYQEVYTRIKEQNATLQVGPSVSWPTLKLITVPEIATEFGLEEGDLLTLELALRRSVWPLIWDAVQSEVRADFVGTTLFAQTALPPYFGSPNLEEIDPVLEFYRELPQLGAHPELETPLPLAITSIDWATENRATGGLKTDYLIGVKQAVSAISFEWVAWRRLSNIPQDPPETSPCRSVGNRGYGVDYCFAGLLDRNGQPRSVWEEFVKDAD